MEDQVTRIGQHGPGAEDQHATGSRSLRCCQSACSPAPGSADQVAESPLDGVISFWMEAMREATPVAMARD